MARAATGRALSAHRYTRTRDLLEDFSKAFQDADRLFDRDLCSSESPIPGVSGARLAEAIRAVGHPPVTFVEQKDQLTEQVLPQLKAGDLVITLGAETSGRQGLHYWAAAASDLR